MRRFLVRALLGKRAVSHIAEALATELDNAPYYAYGDDARDVMARYFPRDALYGASLTNTSEYVAGLDAHVCDLL